MQTKFNEKFLEVYTAAAEVVLGAVMADPEQHMLTVRETLPDSSRFPPTLAAAYDAVIRLYDEGQTITPEVVAAMSGVAVNELVLLAQYGTQATPEVVDADARIILERGQKYVGRNIGLDLSEGRITAQDAAVALDSIQMYGDVQNGFNAEESDDALSAALEGNLPERRPLGLGVFDMWTFSLRGGKSTLIQQKYGGAKTRTTNNIALAAACRDIPVTMFLPDGDQDSFEVAAAADLVAMIAAAWLKTNSRTTVPMNGDGLVTTRAWKKNVELLEAVEAARAIFRRLPIMFYGPRDCDSPERMIAHLRRDTHRRGKGLVILDYIQHMGIRWHGESTVDKAEDQARWIALVNRMGHHAWILSQKNEEAIRNSGENAGTRGGGSVPAQVDLIIEPKYNSMMDPDTIKFSTEKKSRKARGATATYKVEPETGLLLSWEHISKEGITEPRPIYVVPAKLLAPTQMGFNERDDQEDDIF